ncbi:MAG: hypothetical protein CV082_04960 [Candidatus Brocadia sp. BL1]|nr:MAG: hypothetical protein CV082_04960 [Candidatus Brocadia sp. BL1]
MKPVPTAFNTRFLLEIFKKPNCYVFKKWNSNHGILYSAEEDGNGEVLLNIIITKSPGAFNV